MLRIARDEREHLVRPVERERDAVPRRLDLLDGDEPRGSDRLAEHGVTRRDLGVGRDDVLPLPGQGVRDRDLAWSFQSLRPT